MTNRVERYLTKPGWYWRDGSNAAAHFVPSSRSTICGTYMRDWDRVIPAPREASRCVSCGYAKDKKRVVLWLEPDLAEQALRTRDELTETHHLSIVVNDLLETHIKEGALRSLGEQMAGTYLKSVPVELPESSGFRPETAPAQHLFCAECDSSVDANPATWMNGWPKCHGSLMGFPSTP